MKHLVGLDCGNSSFRIFLGKYDGQGVTMELIDQYPNDMVRCMGYDYWDMLRIFDGFKASLKKIILKGVHVDSIGVCTWGIDFALMDGQGQMLSEPLAYRNPMGGEVCQRLTEEEQKEMFEDTGILCDKINSVYMLKAIQEQLPDRFGTAKKLLMVPDVLNYLLTGVMMNEPSELSTSQLMDVRTSTISQKVCQKFGIPTDLFCPIGQHGHLIGNITEALKDELGIDYDIPVVCVPSHDTASAVVAVPALEKDFAFISSGTWSLIGTELEKPLINDEVLHSTLTNEMGAFNHITLLKNNAGMFIIQRLRKEYNAVTGVDNGWPVFVQMARDAEGHDDLIDVNDGRFFNPLNMAKEIWSALCESGQAQGDMDWNRVVRSVYYSLAKSYDVVVKNLEKVTGNTFSKIYIVGGGSSNALLNQMTADVTQKTVVACDKESTVLGNIATQVAYFDPDKGLKEIRSMLTKSIELKEFQPAKG